MKHMITAACCTLAPSPFLMAQKQMPNIVFILADDMGYGDLGCFNKDSKIQTPNMDDLAANGQLYTDAHSSSSVSTPSRYSILTGRYAWRSSLKRGVLFGHDKALIEPERPTVASMLKANGYRTACIGKWHLGLGWQTTDGQVAARDGKNIDYAAVIQDAPVDRGFDYFYGIPASLDMPPFLLIENNHVIDEPSVYYDSEQKNPYTKRRPGYAVKGRKPDFFLPEFTRKAVEKIDEFAKDDRPFFLYFALNAPHTPIAPSKDFKGTSKAGSYGDFVAEVDHVVGKVKEALKKNGLFDNTLLIVTSDNGPETHAYNRGKEYQHYSAGHLKGIKRDLWEGGHRIPFIASWPKGIRKQGQVNHTVCLADFYATALDIVGGKKQSDEAEDSYSFFPLMQGKKETARQFTVHHSGHGVFAIRKGDWVLIDGWGNDNRITTVAEAYYLSRGYKQVPHQSELYNLEADPREFRNEYANRPEIVKELKQLLEKTK